MAFGDRKAPLKRTEMKRKVPVNTDRKPRAPLAQRSKKRTKHMRGERAPQVKALIEAGARCEVCPILQAAGIPIRCGGVIGGLHERRKSSSGGSRSAPANTLPACNHGNGFLEDEPALVRERTGTALVVREGDPEFEELGARAWRERT